MQEGGYAYLGKNALIILVMVSLLKLNLQYYFAKLGIFFIYINNITFGITLIKLAYLLNQGFGFKKKIFLYIPM